MYGISLGGVGGDTAASVAFPELFAFHVTEGSRKTYKNYQPHLAKSHEVPPVFFTTVVKISH